jgi:hypothetical protein
MKFKKIVPKEHGIITRLMLIQHYNRVLILRKKWVIIVTVTVIVTVIIKVKRIK